MPIPLGQHITVMGCCVCTLPTWLLAQVDRKLLLAGWDPIPSLTMCDDVHELGRGVRAFRNGRELARDFAMISSVLLTAGSTKRSRDNKGRRRKTTQTTRYEISTSFATSFRAVTSQSIVERTFIVHRQATGEIVRPGVLQPREIVNKSSEQKDKISEAKVNKQGLIAICFNNIKIMQTVLALHFLRSST